MSALPARQQRAPDRRFAAAVDQVGEEPTVPPEWGEVCALADNLWKDEFDGWRAAAYVHVFHEAGFDPEEVGAAITKIGGSPGGAWLPSSQEIAKAVHKLRYVGTFDWAEETLTQVLGRWTADDADRFYSEEVSDDLADLLRSVHPVYGPMLVSYLQLFGGPYGHVRMWHSQRRRVVWARVIANDSLTLASGSIKST